MHVLLLSNNSFVKANVISLHYTLHYTLHCALHYTLHYTLPYSGESGAGKTESTKLIIKQLIELSHGKTQLEQQIIQVSRYILSSVCVRFIQSILAIIFYVICGAVFLQPSHFSFGDFCKNICTLS